MKFNQNLFRICLLCALLAQSVNSGAQPVITQQPASQTVTNGGIATFAVQVEFGPPASFSYQWRLNGESMSTNEYPVVYPVAGIGSLGYFNYGGFSGDGGPALLANLWFPSGICVDRLGNIYIADQYNNRIRKVDTNGIITTVAGNGIFGYSGDGGSATNASFKWPYSAAVDQNLNLYIADQFNRCIRKVDTNGIITTVAGGGTGGYTYSGGPATNATFGNLTGTDIAVDNLGNLFIADTDLIREVKTNGNIYTVAGGGTNYPGDGGAATNAMIEATGVAVDNLGNVFIAGGGVIQKVDTNGIITTVAGGGNGAAAEGMLATNVSLQSPQLGVAVDVNGNIFVADGACMVVNTNGFISRIVSGDTVTGMYSLFGADAVQVDAYGNAVCSGGNNTVFSLPNSQGPTLQLYGASTNLPQFGPGAQYTVVASNAYGSVTSSVASLSVIWPPGIAVQPAGETVSTGSEVVFIVSAIGSAPLHYQWQYNGVNISNANATTYTVSNASTNSSGHYSVIVTNISGSVTSSLAMLTIGVPPTITNSPMSQVVSSGNDAAFNVSAGGSPTLYYQWFFNGTNISGATSSNYTVVNAATNNAGNYDVVITNAFGSVTSSVATLIVGLSPQIITQPHNIASSLNSSNLFSVVSVGTSPLSYQWWLVSIQNSNAVATPWVVNGFVVGAYIISGGAGYLLPPHVLFLGGSGSGAAGTATISNGIVTAISMSDAGVGYTTPPTIQIAAPSNVVLTNQTNAVLTFSEITNGNAGDYYVVVTNNFGSVASTVVQLVVFVSPYNFHAVSSNNTQLTLQLTGTPNFSYILQSATNLNPPIRWLPILTNQADTSGNWTIMITNIQTPASGFFRAAGQ